MLSISTISNNSQEKQEKFYSDDEEKSLSTGKIRFQNFLINIFSVYGSSFLLKEGADPSDNGDDYDGTNSESEYSNNDGFTYSSDEDENEKSSDDNEKNHKNRRIHQVNMRVKTKVKVK